MRHQLFLYFNSDLKIHTTPSTIHQNANPGTANQAIIAAPSISPKKYKKHKNTNIQKNALPNSESSNQLNIILFPFINN